VVKKTGAEAIAWLVVELVIEYFQACTISVQLLEAIVNVVNKRLVLSALFDLTPIPVVL